jgi:hypothetical protein
MVANMRHGLAQLSDGTILTIPFDKVFDFGSLDVMPSNINEFTVGTTQLFPLGTRMQRDDAVYRYVEFGGTTTVGDMIQAEAPDGAHDDLNPTGSGTDYGTAGTAIGTTVLSIATSITLVVNEYAGGSLVVETNTGGGYRYKVLRNTVSSGTNSSVEIQTGLAIAIDSTSNVKLVKSKYKEVIEAPTTLTGTVVGSSMGVGANGSFGWAQTNGPASVLTEGTVVIGQQVRCSEGTTGAVTLQDYDEAGDADLGTVGTCMDVGPTTEFSLIYLSLE